MEKVVLYYFISSSSLWHWKLTGSAMVGAGNCRTNEGWARTLTDGTSVIHVGLPPSHFVSSLSYCAVVKEGKHSKPPQPRRWKGPDPRAEQQTGPSEVPGGLTGGLRGVAVPDSEGQRCWGRSQLCSCSPLEKSGLPRAREVLRVPCSRSAGRSAQFPEQGRLSSGTATVYVRQ